MKKIFFILAAIFCCFSVNAQSVGAEFEKDKLGKFRITSTNPAEVALVKVNNNISSTGATFNTVEWGNKTYTITSLKEDAFKDYNNSNSTFIFDNLTTFESEAFKNTICNKIDMAESPLTELPKSAFYQCKCAHIDLPHNITTIPEKAFQWSDVTIIILRDKITRIEGAAFYDSKIAYIDLSKVTYIGGNAFYGCSRLTDIDLSAIENISSNAFEDCTNLKNIALPQCLYNVGPYAFDDCALKSLSLYNTVNGFGYNHGIMADDGTVTMNIVDWSNRNALSGNSGINQAITYKYNDVQITGEYTLPDDLTTLGEGALYHCTDITAITMPAGLKQIGAKALAKCTKLSAIRCYAAIAPVVADADAFSEVDKNSVTVTIPDNAESYYSYTHTTGWKDFYNYQVTLPTIKGAAITELNHTAGSQPSQAVQGIMANYSTQINAAADKAEVEALTQEGIAAITAQIKTDRGLVKIGNLYYLLDSEHHTATVTYGGLEGDGYATAEYTGSISIPESVTYNDATYSVTTIGEHAFQKCTGLTSINMPMMVTKIDNYAFYSCTGLKTLVLPYMINFIGDEAFNGCSALTSITSLSPTPSTLGYNPFDGVSKSIPVTVQSNSLTHYQEGPWAIFWNFITNPTLDEAKTNAKNAITAALGSYSSVSYIGNLALNFCQRIEAATTAEQVEALRTEGVYAVIYSISTYKEILGEMGEPCEDCPSVEVTGQNDNTIKLYNPKSVKFKKE